jgi:hypothetical protein
MIILPTAYFGSTEYWTALVKGGEDVVLDLGENYVKRSERNRTRIMTSGGVMQLSVQLCHANKPRQPITSMQVDYSKRWQHQHIVAIESAYRSSPYYDHYSHLIEGLFSQPWERLVDLNLATLKAVCKALKIAMPTLSEEYVRAEEGDIDMRDKKRGSTFVAEPYIQVFCDRLPFAPNLSILDLLMCEGPEAINVLRRSKL